LLLGGSTPQQKQSKPNKHAVRLTRLFSECVNILQKPHKTLSLALASLFIVGAMCGSGVLALPKALVDAGWAGKNIHAKGEK